MAPLRRASVPGVRFCSPRRSRLPLATRRPPPATDPTLTQMPNARKGYCHMRWQLNGREVDLVNVHLFHDASNLEALSQVRGALAALCDVVETLHDAFPLHLSFLFSFIFLLPRPTLPPRSPVPPPHHNLTSFATLLPPGAFGVCSDAQHGHPIRGRHCARRH